MVTTVAIGYKFGSEQRLPSRVWGFGEKGRQQILWLVFQNEATEYVIVD
jgi:hypothetical protein